MMISSTSSSSSSSKKTLTIKPFKQQPKLPENYEADSWNTLEKALRAVYTRTALEGVSKEELYRIVEDLCIHKKAAELYERLARNCREHVRSKFESIESETSTKDLAAFVALVDDIWQDHCEALTSVRNIFIYLDRSYALSTTSVKSIWDLGMEYLKQFFEEKSNIETKLIVGLLATIEADRQGQVVEVDRIQRLLRMFSVLGTYRDKFETPMLMDSKRFFSTEGRHSMEVYDAAQFLEHVDRRITEARDMSTRYLDSSSRQPLIHIVEQYMLAPHSQQLLDKGLNSLLEGDRLQDLKRFYCLLERVGQLEELKKGWTAYIKKIGESFVQDEGREKTLIEDLLQLQERSDSVLKVAFNTQDSFKQAFKATMFAVVNLKSNHVAELLARFIDRKLRGEKGMQETDTEQSFDKVMALFKQIQGKDVFEAFYKKLLAKRLLLGKSASYELEKSMLGRLKTECGSGFTSKLDGMFHDIDLSRDTMTAYSTYLTARRVALLNEPETAIQVLTTGFWPSTPSVDGLVVPHYPFLPIIERFEDFYKEKYTGRRLAWSHSLGRCLIMARFGRSVRKELEVSFFQALVLLCFKEPTVSVLTFEQIRSLTGIEVGELQRILQSLACGVLGTRVLTKEPKGKDVNEGDAFIVNEQFNNKLFRVKINTIQLKETVEEVEKTHEEIFRERQYQVDAAIVRIMKTRKRLQHTSLMSELLSQLKFPARANDIKQRIESLIEREYLERDRDDSSYYNYKA